MDATGSLLVAIGQTLAFIGAVLVVHGAHKRTRSPPAADQPTWADARNLFQVIDRRIARNELGAGAVIILVGLALSAIGAWLQIAA